MPIAVNGTSFGKMVSHIVIIKELEIILDVRQATQKRDIHTKRRRPGEDKGRGGGPAVIAEEKRESAKLQAARKSSACAPWLSERSWPCKHLVWTYGSML